eukprot:5473574-Pleurochrysis_carterae.AAC.1
MPSLKPLSLCPSRSAPLALPLLALSLFAGEQGRRGQRRGRHGAAARGLRHARVLCAGAGRPLARRARLQAGR